MEEVKGKLENLEEEGTQQDKLASFLAKYDRLKRTEQRAELLARKEEEEKEKQRKHREERKKALRKVAEAKQGMKLARAYAGVAREPRNKRQEHATGGFFNLMNMCNDPGKTDFSDAYNFIADTAWLLQAVKECTKCFGGNHYISIDRLALRGKVFARENEVQKRIDDAQTLFESEWAKDQGKDKEQVPE